jgi:pteridine reductase
MELAHPAVLVTSGTKRLGLALAKQALAMGMDVVLHYRSHTREANSWLSRNPSMRTRVALLQASLSPANAAEVIAQARGCCRTLVGLVNNAAVFTRGNLSDSDHLQNTLTTNAIVPAALTAAFAGAVDSGWVVNVTDARVDAPNRNYQNYRVSKLLLTELTRQQAFLYAPAVRVNAIAPGAILPAAGASRTEFDRLSRQVPMGRTGTLADIAEGFACLVRGDYLTGQVLFVDGGSHLVPR